MNLEVVESGPVERRLRIEIPTVQVDAVFDAVYREIGREARVRGFRPGRVPRAMLELHFSERARHEVLERLVQSSLPEAVQQESLAVVSEPRLKPEGEPRTGGPFVYEATVEIRPEIRLEKVRGLEVVRPQLPEPEKDPVESYLTELRQAHAQLEPEPQGTRAGRGHVAVVDYQVSLEGKPLAGGTAKEQELELGSGRAIAGFESELEGMAAGETREFDLQLPDTWPEEAARGRSAQFRVMLQELKRKVLPELDDDLARDASEFETLAELRANVLERVERGREAARKRELREAVLRKLVEGNPFDVPPSLVERQLASRLSRAVKELRGRIPDQELGKLIERWREEWRTEAEADVRVGFLVPEIAEAEKLEVGEEDLDERLRAIAEERGEGLAKLKRQYKEKGLLETLRAGMLEERVVEFLLSEAKLSDA